MKDEATGKPLFQGTVKDGLYLLAEAHLPEANVGEKVGSESWHHRLGHPNIRVLMKVISTYGFPPLSVNKTTSCDACLASKSHRLPYSTSSHQTTKPLEIIHSDLWGQPPVISHTGHKYYVIFIDDFTKYTWLYPLLSPSFLIFNSASNANSIGRLSTFSQTGEANSNLSLNISRGKVLLTGFPVHTRQLKMEPLSTNIGISSKQLYLSCATHPSHFNFGTKPPALPFTSSIGCLPLSYKIALLTLSSTIKSPPIPSYDVLVAPAIPVFAHMPLPSSTPDPRNAYFSAIVRLTWDIAASLSQVANSTSVGMLFFEKMNIHTNSLPLIVLSTYPHLPNSLGLLPHQSQLITRHWLSLLLQTSSFLSHQLLTYLCHHLLR